MEKRTLLIFSAIFVGFMGVMLYISNQNKTDLSGYDFNKIIEVEEGDIAEHIYGEHDHEKAILIEYGDFQCPSCGTMNSVVKKIVDDFKGDLTFVFRNFPLDGHQNALSAAAAAEAAGLQGKYWEMNNLLFEKQSDWSTADITQRNEKYTSYAEDLGLDIEQFKSDMKSAAVSKKIKFDRAIAKEIKATGTPTFVLNGESISSDIWGDEEKFREAIKKAIEK